MTTGYLVLRTGLRMGCLGFSSTAALVRTDLSHDVLLSFKGSDPHKKSKKKKKHKHKDRDVRKCCACKCTAGGPKNSFSPVICICRGMFMTTTAAFYPAGSVAVCDGLYTFLNVHVT